MSTKERFIKAIKSLGEPRQFRAEVLGMSYRQVQAYETGEAAQTYETLERLERAGIITIHDEPKPKPQQAA